MISTLSRALAIVGSLVLAGVAVAQQAQSPMVPNNPSSVPASGGTFTGNVTAPTLVLTTSELLGVTTLITTGILQYTDIEDAGGNGYPGGNFSVLQFSNDSSSAFFNFAKTRNTIKGANWTVPVQNNDDMGELNFAASDGTTLVKSGYFTSTVDNTVSTSVVPGRFEWGSQNSLGVLNEHMRLSAEAVLSVGDSINNTYNDIILNPGSSVSTPVAQVTGSAMNIGWNFKTQGTGSFEFFNATAPIVLLSGTPSGVNYINLSGAAASSSPLIQMLGSDSSIGLAVETKGLGNVVFDSGGFAPMFAMIAVGSAVDYLAATPATAGNPGYPKLSATGSDTNVGMNFVTKGTGVLEINGTPGITTVCTVTALNTLTFTAGLLTGKGANCT